MRCQVITWDGVSRVFYTGDVETARTRLLRFEPEYSEDDIWACILIF